MGAEVKEKEETTLKPHPKKQIQFRLTIDHIRVLGKLAASLSTEYRTATKSDAVRWLIDQLLAERVDTSALKAR